MNYDADNRLSAKIRLLFLTLRAVSRVNDEYEFLDDQSLGDYKRKYCLKHI